MFTLFNTIITIFLISFADRNQLFYLNWIPNHCKIKMKKKVFKQRSSCDYSVLDAPKEEQRVAERCNYDSSKTI